MVETKTSKMAKMQPRKEDSRKTRSLKMYDLDYQLLNHQELLDLNNI